MLAPVIFSPLLDYNKPTILDRAGSGDRGVASFILDIDPGNDEDLGAALEKSTKIVER